MTISILLFLCLAFPAYWEINNDKDGDLNKSNDLWIRIILMVLISGIAHCLKVNFFIAFNMSVAWFFMFFDYIVTYIMIKNGTLEPPVGVKYHWFNYQAKSGVIDNLKFWKRLNPWVKLLIKVVYFGVAIWLYFK